MSNAERLIRSALKMLNAAHDALPVDNRAARVAVLRALDALDEAIAKLPPKPPR